MVAQEHLLSEDYRATLYKIHVQGAFVWSAISAAMWLFALFAFWFEDIQASNFIGITAAVLFIVLMNPPTLFTLKRIANRKTYANFSLFINLLEVVGYTGVIYATGGFEATFLTPIYAGLIAYLGAMAPRRVPFIVAGFCAFCYGSMVVLVGLDIIPSLKIDPNFNPPLSTQIIRCAIVMVLLFIVAYISAFTAGRIKKARDRLRQQNRTLEEKKIELENSQVKLAIDVIQRKEAELKLQKSEEKYRFLAENMADIVWTLDRQFNATYLSPSIEKVLGYTPEQMMQRSLQEVITPSSWKKVMALSKKAFQRDLEPGEDPDRSISIEVEYYTKDGATVWMEDTVKPIRDTEGKITGVYGVSHNITARKTSEIQRLKLERRILKAEKTESLGRMAGAIAHLFNNKLSVVQGNLELSLVNLQNDKGLRENLIEAIEATQEASEIGGLMLSYLGLGSGKRAELDLAGVFRQKLPLLQNNVPDNIVLETDIMTDGPVVLANDKQLWQIFSQLLNNAREAIGNAKGQINLTIRTITAGDISKANLFPADWDPKSDQLVSVEVKDTGCGIAAEDLDKIFDPFYTTKFTGRGLGLAVTLGIVKSWGGAIGLESTQHLGSVASVYLPVASDVAPPPPEKKKPPKPSWVEGDRVLLVDDQENVRRMGTKMLSFLGYNVMTASCGSEALEMFRSNRESIRCVITDLSMPDMDGWQTLAELRALDPALPVILSSGYDETEVMNRESADQPHAFLHKPYSLKELRQKLSQILEDKA